MIQTENNTIQDVAFIGAGIATAYAILGLLETTGSQEHDTPLKVTILDKHPDFFKGIPYGERSGNSVLLINALNRFLPQPHRALFVEWLNKNKDSLLNDFQQNGGVKTKRWVSENLSMIRANKWDTLYIPRYFYGKYISEVLYDVISENENKGVIEVTYVEDQVDDLSKNDSVFAVSTGLGKEIQAKNVVLSIGSLPTKQVFGDTSIIKNAGYLLINDLYEGNLPESFDQIEGFLDNRKGRASNLLVLGANASGLETLYKFSDEEQLKRRITSYTVLSSQGIMPDSDLDIEGQKRFIPENLMVLSEIRELTAERIAKAAYNDLAKARKMGLGAASTVDVISQYVGALLPRLSFTESKIFACQYGNNIGRMQRCAGSHYTNTLKELSEEKNLRHLAGRFSSLKSNENADAGLQLEYIALGSGERTIDPIDFHIVVNCMGATNLSSSDTPLLLRNLIEKEYITPNASGIGLDVDTDFQASENLYVIGPLLAGNVIDNKPLWHLEHCGRIIWSSNLMSKSLAHKINSTLA